MTKKILLVTDGIFHPPLLGGLRLHKMFSEMDGFSFAHISSLEKLPSDLSSCFALVLNYHHKTISSTAFERLDTFVKNGGGILAIHAATASFKQSLPYFKILGGRFIGHGKVERFQVERVKDRVFDGIDDFEVRDELYIHELESDIEVHFTAKHEGQNIPVVWTRRHGKGKVCYAVPGHTAETIGNKTYQEVLKRGLEWVCE